MRKVNYSKFSRQKVKILSGIQQLQKKEPEKLLTLAAIEILKFDIQVDSAIQKIFKDTDFTLSSKHIQELSSECEKCNT